MIYYAKLHPPVLGINIWYAKTRKGLCCVSFSKTENEFIHRLSKKYADEQIFAPKILRKETAQLKRYFDGRRRKNFAVRTDLEGSDFQLKVWRALARIPYGKVVSYSQIARAVREPNAVRAVANACGKNPLPVIIPCHRVVAKNGSLGGYTGGIHIKRSLLAIESNHKKHNL
jgi:O-6-methylguanine DNA methyltransferase